MKKGWGMAQSAGPEFKPQKGFDLRKQDLSCTKILSQNFKD
jgi:hypothetical protein